MWKAFDCKGWNLVLWELWVYRKERRKTVSSHLVKNLFHSRITKPKMAEYLRYECSSNSGWTKIIRRWSNNARYFTSLSSGKKLQLEIVVLSKVIYCIWIFVNKVMPNNSSPWLDRVKALYKSCLAQFKPEVIVDQLACGGNNISQHLWSQRLCHVCHASLTEQEMVKNSRTIWYSHSKHKWHWHCSTRF